MKFVFEMRISHNTTYLIKDSLLFFRLLITFNGSFLWSWLFLSITFLFQIGVFFQTADTKLKHKQPEVVIIYVGGSIQCCSIWFVFTSISFQYLIKGLNLWVGKVGNCPLQVWTE